LRQLDPWRNAEIGRFGQGFAIAKALVEAYSGTMVAQSELGRGTRSKSISRKNLDLFAPFVIPKKNARSRFTSIAKR
jgi:signal transduction histidine kinase